MFYIEFKYNFPFLKTKDRTNIMKIYLVRNSRTAFINSFELVAYSVSNGIMKTGILQGSQQQNHEIKLIESSLLMALPSSKDKPQLSLEFGSTLNFLIAKSNPA